MLLLLAGGFVVWLGAGRAIDRFEVLPEAGSHRSHARGDAQRLLANFPRPPRLRERDSARWKMFFLDTKLFTTGNREPYAQRLCRGARGDWLDRRSHRHLLSGVLLSYGMDAHSRGKKSAGSGLHIGALSACCGLLAHSLVDFNLHIPSNALFFLIQAALATSATPTRALRLPEAYTGTSTKLNMRRSVRRYNSRRVGKTI